MVNKDFQKITANSVEGNCIYDDDPSSNPAPSSVRRVLRNLRLLLQLLQPASSLDQMTRVMNDGRGGLPCRTPPPTSRRDNIFDHGRGMPRGMSRPSWSPSSHRLDIILRAVRTDFYILPQSAYDTSPGIALYRTFELAHRLVAEIELNKCVCSACCKVFKYLRYLNTV